VNNKFKLSDLNRQKLPYLSKEVSVFIFRLIALFIAYKILFFIIWRVPNLTQLHKNYTVFVIKTILYPVKWLLEFFEYPVLFLESERVVRIANSGGVRVSPPCSGLDIMFLYLALILSFPAKIKQKLYYSIGGILIIHLLNISRITALALLSYYAPEWVEINHKIIFNIIVYSIIVYLFYTYINKQTYRDL
jgi:exosortase/archaeosortase family protein